MVLLFQIMCSLLSLPMVATLNIANRYVAVPCTGILPWQGGVVYNQSQQVIYRDHLWSAKWGSYNAIPGSVTRAWLDMGPCQAGTIPPIDCNALPEWQDDVPYYPGQQVMFSGDLWTARWWSYNNSPPANLWMDDGLCPITTTATGSTVSPTCTMAVIFTTVVLMEMTPAAPSITSAPTSKAISAVSCTGVPGWQMNVAYSAGQKITYNGHLWTAKAWSYNEVPGGAAGAWVDNGVCGTSTTCTAIPAWQMNVAYGPGSQVLYNGHLWEANWYSYNDVPGGAAGVWYDLGPCQTTTTTTTTSTTSTTSTTTSTTSSTTSSTSKTSMTSTSTSSTIITSFETCIPITLTVTSTSFSVTSTVSGTTPVTGTSGVAPIPIRRVPVPITPGITPAIPTSTLAFSSGSCAGVLPWRPRVDYFSGQRVVYNGHLWTAIGWSYNDLPGGAMGVWMDKGPCES